MEPVVSPILVYFIYLADTIKIFALLMGILLLALTLAFDMVEEPIKSKWACIIGAILFLIGIFIPSKEAIIAMIVAQHVTPDNLNIANEVLQNNIHDYLTIILNTKP